MALIKADRVRETSTTTGTGAVTLAGAVSSYQTFSSVMANTDTCYYCIANQGANEWETGLGTYASGGNTLTRTTVVASSNSGSAVTFSAGTKDVFITALASQFPAKVVYASTLAGIHLNSNVSSGGGTDDTAVLQAALGASGDTGSILFVMDGAALVTGLNIHSNTTIWCLNQSCGFYLKNASNRPIVRNINPSATVVTDTNITLMGGTYNGNYTNQTTIAGGEGDVFIQGIAFYSVTGLNIRDIKIINATQYACAMANCTNVRISGCELQQGLRAGCDGFHFYGGGSNFKVSDCWGQTGSDFVAINSSDYLDRGTSTWVTKEAPLSNIVVENLYFQASANGVGILSATQDVTDVTVRGVHGTVRDYAISIWNAWGNTFQGGHVKNVILENVTANWSGATHLNTYPSIINVFADGQGACYCENLQIRGCGWTNNDTRPWLVIGITTTIGVLNIDGFTIDEYVARATPGAIVENRGTVTKMNIQGVTWNRPGESAAGYVVSNISGSTITELVLNNISTSNTSGLVSNAGTITTRNGNAPTVLCYVFGNTQVIASDSAYHQLSLVNTGFDPLGMLSSNAVVIPTGADGYYQTTMTIPINGPTAGTCTARVYKNGSPAIDYFRSVMNTSNFIGNGTSIDHFNGGDSLTLYVLQDSGSGQTVTNGQFRIVRVA